MRRRGLPITGVLVASVGALVFVAVALVFATGYQVARKNTEDLIREKTGLVIELVTESTRNHFDPVRAQLEFLAELVAEGEVDLLARDAVGRILLGGLAALPQASSIAFVDTDLRVLRAFRQRRQSRLLVSDWSDDPETRLLIVDVEGRDEAHWGGFFVAEPVGRTYINLLMPVRADGIFRGALIAAVSITELSRNLSRLGREHADYVFYNAFILVERRFVLAHPLLADGFPALSDARPLPELNEFDDPVLASIWAEERAVPVDAAFLGRSQVQARAVELAGSQYMFLYQHLDGFGAQPWIVGTHVPMETIAAPIDRLNRMWQYGLGVLVVALALAFLLGRAISRPARRLAEAAGHVRELDLDSASAQSYGLFRELNEAADAFNAMISGLRSFETYVPRALVQRLVRQGNEAAIRSDERDLTILFSDIVGFTRLSENLPAPDVAAFLNRHFTHLNSAVEAEGGTLDKYMGDGALAFWGAPERLPDHAERACRAALAIATAIDADNVERRRANLAPVRLRIGIHSGSVVVGNIGAPTRINYTIVGDPVNTAERLHELAVPAEDGASDVCVLLSAEVANRLGAAFRLVPLGQRTLRGRQEPIEVFRLEIP